MEKRSLLEDLFLAYYNARKNKRNTINQLRFEMDLEHNLFDLCCRIQKKEYVPDPCTAFIISKPVKREVFTSSFRDRVIHHLFFNYVSPVFERTYIHDCYSCRKGKGSHYGVKRIDHHIRSCSGNYTRPCFVLKLDLRGYFMSIDRAILHKQVTDTLHKYADRKDSDGIKWKDKLDYDLILYLAQAIIFNDPTKNFHRKGSPSDWDGLPPDKSLLHSPEGCGIPIGNLTSQLFSNVYLASFDNYIKRELRFKHYGRYVDDFYIVHQDKNILKEAIPKIAAFLRDKLKITLHPKKIYLQKYENGVLYTGAYIKPHRIYVGNKTKANMRKALEEQKTKENVNLNSLRCTVNSYLGTMKHYRSFHIRKKIMTDHAWVFKYGCVRNCCSYYKLSGSPALSNLRPESLSLAVNPENPNPETTFKEVKRGKDLQLAMWVKSAK
ncbi:MAG: RNA-directed DNA polymerase [Prevotella sp.]|jgi:hypothetical protein|nr:RNA-directed DNA polymerase [Prevotella sp.]